MEREEKEARMMLEKTGEVWRPVRFGGILPVYLISARGLIFNFKTRRAVAGSAYTRRGGSSKFFRLLTETGQKFFTLDVLMQSAFPERSANAYGIEWRAIVLNGEQTGYEVSFDGRVRRTDNLHELKPTKRGDGYCLIRIRHEGETKTLYLHRLVAEAFIPNPAGLPVVNHKDENRCNNSAENLEWCSKQYNMLYGGASKRAGAHTSMTMKLKHLAKTGNQIAAEILRHPRYYDSPELFSMAAAIT